MRLVFLILFSVAIAFSSALKAETLVVFQTELTDGGHKKFKKKKYKARHFIKKHRLSINESKIPVDLFQIKKRTKGGAILMAVLTGPLGGHRLYLGTEPYVPIVYALTLGGGMGLLPAIDIIVILVSKDLSKYENSSQIIMWGN
jgi:hypothetical protein